MPSLKEFLDKLFAISKGEDTDHEFRKALTGLGVDEIERRVMARRRALAKFLKHHVCTGTLNGAPVWRRLPSYYKTKYDPRECRARGCR